MSLEKCLETIANNQKQGKEGKLAKKISKLEIDPSTNVRFTYSDGCDVVHYNETHHDDALEYTDVVSKLTEALTQTSAFLTDCKHVLGGCIDYGDLDEDSIPTESSLLLKGFIASVSLVSSWKRQSKPPLGMQQMGSWISIWSNTITSGVL
jgi:hypothetical protein